jgi:hypothetical protein
MSPDPGSISGAGMSGLLKGAMGFTYDAYKAILEHLKKTHRLGPFSGARRGAGPYVILRHDVDGSLVPALRIAEVERRLGVRATYFVGFSMKYYNLSEEHDQACLRELTAMGHEIGLHYDALAYLRQRASARRILEDELRTLGRLAGRPVSVVARHNVNLSGKDPFAGSRRPLNAYNHEFFKDALYISDSCRAWYLGDLERLLSDPPQRVQLLTHPMLWTETVCDRETLLDRFFDEIEGENAVYKESWKGLWRSAARVKSYDRELGVRKGR